MVQIHTYNTTTSGFGNVQGVARFCAYNGKLYFGSDPYYVGDPYPEVYESSDNGLTWTSSYKWGIGFAGNNVNGMAVINGKMYVAIGTSAYIWEYDGSNWTQVAGVRLNGATGLPSQCYDMIADGNTLYWVGNSIGTATHWYPVYSSTDGAAWSPELVVAKATYTACIGETIRVFDSDIHVACRISGVAGGRIFKKSAGVWDVGVAKADTQYWYGMHEFKGDLYCLGNSISNVNHWQLYKYDGSWGAGNLQLVYSPAAVPPRFFVSADGYLMASGPDHTVAGKTVAQVYYSTDGTDFSNLEDYSNITDGGSRFYTATIISEGRTLIGGVRDPLGCVFYTGIDFVVDFSATPTSGADPLTVDFTDLTTGNPTSWDWDFGDLSPHSTDQNPTHVYSGVGTYTVTLIARNDVSEATETKIDYITVYPPAPVANFSGAPTSGVAPLAVTFTDLSTNTPTSWDWDFGDLSLHSTDQNPSHVYNVPGTYTVTLIATNASGSDTEIKTDYITVNPPPAPVANFSGTPTSGGALLTVVFTDLSSNAPLSWDWDFGDSSPHSTEQNPTHVYNESGIYTVTLIATNGSGSDTEVKTDYITVTPTAEFSGTPTLGFAPLTVDFTDLTVGSPISWDWDFGDLSLHSTDQNPSHVYASAGVYTVTLTAAGLGGSDFETKIDYITVLEPLIAEFVGVPTSDYDPLTVNFTDLSTGTPTAWSWNFGDPASGSSNISTDQNPSHTFSAPGFYTITLTVTNVGGTDTLVKTDYIESLLVAADFTGTPLTGTAPLTVQFSNASTFPALTFFWDFGDGSIGSGATPLHIYAAPGSYTVTLTASHPDFGAYTATKVDYVVVSVPVPVPVFSATPIIGFEPSTVIFTNESTGFPSAYLWDFGDGYTSVEENPTHIYSLEGTYSVTLTVYNEAAPDGVISIPTDVIVLPVPNLVADYTTGSMTPNAGGISVQFVDASIEALTWSWNFGDPVSGTLNTSHVQNPSHVYSAVGTYQITLTVTHGPFSDSICKNVLVTTDVLRHIEIWGTARFADGTQVAADRVVSVGREITSTEYECGSSATDTYHSYKTINDSGVTRFLVRGRGNVIGIPDSGFEDGAPVYLFIGGRQATVELQNIVVPWSSPFFMTLPSDPTSSIEVDVVFPLVTTAIYPEPGTYEDRTEISFTNNILPLVVYYTLDGTDPKTSATRQLYIGPFYIEEGVTTIKYYSEDSLGSDEITREAVYVIHGPLVYASPEAGDYSVPLSITLTGNRSGTIYYRLNHTGIYAIYQEPIRLEAGPTGVRTTFIEAYLVDEHAQVGATQEFEYKIDLLNPVITSYTLSNSDPVTTQQMITVQVEASSYTNTVTGLLLSTYPDFHDTSVRLYQPEVVFVLPDPDGMKTVYAQVIDQFGRISSIKSQTIELDTEIPVFTVSASPSEPIGETSYIFTGTKSVDSGIYLIINGGTETLVIPFSPSTTWEYEVPLVEGINTLQFQAGTVVRNRSGIEVRTVDVRPIPQGVTQATTITGSGGTWRIPFVFFDEKTGEEGTIDLNPPLKQHRNIKKRHHDFRILVTSDFGPDPVVTFPTQDAVLTEKVITVTGTAAPGSKITLTVQRRGKVPA